VSGRIVDFQKSPHQATQELLPWFANGSLDADEHQSLAAHLENCSECRQELEALRRLQTAYVASDVTADVEGALARLWEHVPAQATDSAPAEIATAGATLPLPAAPPGTRPPASRRRWYQALMDHAPTLVPATSSRNLNLPSRGGPQRASLFGMALAAQFGVIVALGFALLTWQNAPARFHALGAAQSPTRAAGDAVIVFTPNIEERRMQRILEDAAARIVDGPTAANGYVIRFDRGDVDEAIARLSSDPAVHLVARLRSADGG
jgi:anti-sigma factor RsiW